MSLDPALKMPAAAKVSQETTPTGMQTVQELFLRRALFSLLSVATIVWLGWWLAKILAVDGFGVLDFLMVVAFFTNAPWIVIGFWNSVFGFWLLHGTRDPLTSVLPAAADRREKEPVHVRVAILMTVRNEEPARAAARLRTVRASLDRTGFGDKFDYFVLSDSNRPGVIAEEEAAFAEWRKEFSNPDRMVYRHREKNTGFKAGNVRDFCERWGSKYEIMIPLDADSLMTGASILRLVRIMQATPKLGILQSLVVGMPSPSFFARVFQFGMRHAMRSFTTGSAWWHADCGPFWGHNAAVRIAPFTEHCKLPDLPGKPPFGGHILSHDQIEAIMMRKAGYEVRVLPEEEGSYEENPPALPDFMVRDLRWCQGNLQYFKLVGLPELPTGRFNILFAIQMFIGVAGLILFIVLAALSAVLWPANVAFPTGSALALYLVWLFMYFTPKFAGLADAIIRSPRHYGGMGRLLGGGALETVFTFLLVPISMVGQTIFMVALAFGKMVHWDAQRRDRYRLQWSEALKVLWPHTLFGAAIFLLLLVGNPAAIPWFLPFLTGLLLSVPFAVFTASPELGAWGVRMKLCGIPEEFEPLPEIEALQSAGH
jgi:membrane glycosyltransferase